MTKGGIAMEGEVDGELNQWFTRFHNNRPQSRERWHKLMKIMNS